jgi:L-alanine-DL-glutamate epimerase-like enolase superfamily enzyme
MRIDRITASVIRYPLPRPLRPSWAPGREFGSTTCTLLEVTTDDGVVGYGAAPDTGQIGLATISDMVAPYVLGKDPFQVEEISPILRNAARDGSYPWGFETALWDIIGKAAGMPVYRLWGAHKRRIRAYASLAELTSVEEQVERLSALKALGFTAAKLRLRRPSIREDIAFVEGVRSAIGDSMELMVDANQAHVMPSPGPHNFWRFEDALAVARAMQDLGVVWLEEPLHRYDYGGLARLCDAVDIPIAGGELNLGLHEYKLLIDRGCYDIIQADCAFSEGVFQLRKVAALAELAYKRFIPHTWSNGVGLAANLQLAAATPNCDWFEFPIDPPAWTPAARDFMLDRPFEVDADGYITVGDAPGMGMEFDREAVAPYVVATWDSRAAAS